MSETYNRYNGFIENDGVRLKIPFIEISKLNSDLYITYNRNKMRMDMLSYKYYGDANYGWLILQANPHLGGFEFSIPNGVQLRIPYPLDTAIQRYEMGIKKWKNDNNIEY